MHTAIALLTVLSTLAYTLPSDLAHNTVLRRADPVAEPPGSVNALRDPSKLKYEIAGICGAYLLWLIVTVFLIVFVRLRLRRSARKTHIDPDMTMMKTFPTKVQVVEVPAEIQSPNMQGLKSPGKMSSIRSWGRKGHKANMSIQSTSTFNSLHSIEQQRAKDMDDLTRLYAAAMAHDEARSAQNSAAQSPITPLKSPTSPQYPPEFEHLRQASANAQPLRSPVQSQQLHHPLAPTPIDDSFPGEARSYYDPSIPSRNSTRTTRTTPLSTISDSSSRAASVVSTKSRPSKISVRGQFISQPIGSADLRDAQYYDETIPLSPRVYTPGPPPPTPGRKKKVQIEAPPAELEASEYLYLEPRQNFSRPQPNQPQPLSPVMQSEDRMTHLPKSPRERRAPPSLALRPSAGRDRPIPAGPQTSIPTNASKALLFRDMYGDTSLRSAPPTKTTFLDHPQNVSSGPRTGVPSTPYSPYMPHTPMTPITPRRMLNKQELKAKRKEERLKVLSEDDLVGDDEDVWGK